MPTCFIIMPISTPPEAVKQYGDDADHFKHVLECLHKPAVKAAGFDPIPPAATGSEIIQANIIKQLAEADMVLCDMACLNPNVFYEFGIRTALNKPVTVVHDEHIKRIPFDTGIINAYPYASSMKAWELETNRKGISEHIAETAKRSKDQNLMWTYFGIPQIASLPTGKTSPEQMMEVVLAKIESLEKSLGAIRLGFNPWTIGNRSLLADALESEEEKQRKAKTLEGIRQFLEDTPLSNSVTSKGEIAKK